MGNKIDRAKNSEDGLEVFETMMSTVDCKLAFLLYKHQNHLHDFKSECYVSSDWFSF